MDPDSKRILVALRIRPQNEAEKFDVTAVRKVDFKSVMVISEELHTSASDSPCIGFSFDAVFDDSDDQRTVYEDGCLGMIDAALDGHFVTILAYGQTGSGKTHTILGAPARPNGDLQDQTGMFLRVFNDLFIYQANMRTRMQVLIALSAVELYVDDIFDLLGDKAKVRLREVGSDAVLSGTKYVEVKSLHEVIAYFSIANAARSVTATKMNATSSRSHALFFIDVFQIPVSSPNQTPLKIEDVITTEGDVKTIKNMVRSRISLVDLAGSERTKKSGVEGQGLVEANAINKSLSTLGNVINALYTRKSHIPFRDHRLTSILRPALLDEKSRVLLVGQVSPASSNSAESIMTLKFCDRLKNLKADSVSLTENPELLQAHANASRQAAEMAADVLLSRERALYSLSRPRFRALRSGASLRDALTNATSRAQAESQAALDKIAKEDAEWLQMKRDAESKKQIALKLEQRMALESLVHPLELEVASLRAAFDNLTATFTEATDLKMTQAKKAKKTRVQLEEKLKELAQENEKMDTALEYTAARLLALERMKSQPKPQQPETKDADWIAQEEEWAQQEGNHGIVQDFYRLWKPLGEAHADFIKASHAGLAAARSAKEAKGTAAQAKASATTASILGNLVPDVVHYCIDRAVDIATGVIDPSEKFEWFYVYGSSTKLKDWHFWPNPINTTPDPRFPGPSGITASHELTTLSDDDATMDVTGPQRSAATASPVEPPVLEITHAQAVKNAREKRKQNRTAGANNVSKRFESEEANKHYLMTVYDSPTLVQDVSRFLGAGTIMEKHGRSGTPHKKKVFIATTSGQREVVWVDPPEAGAPTGGARSSIPVAGLSKIVLGAYSKVFKRHPSTPNDPPFYLSFTLHTKDKSRTLDLVADTLVDFEAWVLGLSHMVQVDPVWGGTLNIPKEVAVQLQLNPKEVSLCEKENILPSVYAAIRKLITEHRDEVSHQMQIFDNDPVQAYESMGGIHAPQMNHKGAVLMTKGELRYHTKNWNIDIFRVCKLWTLFREMDLIYDPSFLPATCFGTNLRT